MHRIKKHHSFTAQVNELAAKGLHIEDPQEAQRFLSRVNYYHLRGYYIDLLPSGSNQFRENSTFDQISHRFEIDCKLRDVLWPSLRVIELRMRTLISYSISCDYGPIGYRDPKIYRKESYLQEQNRRIDSAIERSSEPFIKHHKDQYLNVFPIWVAIETLTLGELSKMYSNLNTPIQKAVAAHFDYPTHRLLDNSFRALTILRNLCAHHARIYGRSILSTCPVLKSDKKIAREIGCVSPIESTSIYACILAIVHLLPREKVQTFAENLVDLLTSPGSYNLDELGFPDKWDQIIFEIIR